MSSPQEARSSMDSDMLTSQHLQNREREGAHPLSKSRPLQLLDLPIDILQAIVREITRTNDLTALALTHSFLHTLVIPHIYSRFDIVWPDAGPTVESRIGVDALTYGLATLVMAQDVFGEAHRSRTHIACATCGSLAFCQHQPAPPRRRRVRRGNNFAFHTRNFSVGNGPEDWVKEYLITKEGGKMLGTLVALAIGRMRNLESFTWDMPTGVLRDIWLALASLDGREDGVECRLERVWVRWHDNQDALLSSSSHVGAPSILSNTPRLIPGLADGSFQIPLYSRVEFPTLSVLPPLKSLSVLDIDELSYVEEMSVLIEVSRSQLQELRVGLARHAQNYTWARPKEDRAVVPPPPSQSRKDILRPGGILGVLISRLRTNFDNATFFLDKHSKLVDESGILQERLDLLKDGGGAKTESSREHSDEIEVDQLGALLSAQNLEHRRQQSSDSILEHIDRDCSTVSTGAALPNTCPEAVYDFIGNGSDRLRLGTLELERIHLSIPILSKALDWSRLRTLTILSCRDHEQLWKALRRKFAPQSRHRSSSIFKSSTSSQVAAGRYSPPGGSSSLYEVEYGLHVTRLHTDAVSPSLLAFLKDALAPNTVQHLFLQQSPTYKSSITIDHIYKHVIRRHRGSLVKLLIDSEIRTADESPDGNPNWRRWAASRELITCITSGRMCLRELSISVDYKDWHYLLQRLPNAPKLRSLHISHIADYIQNRVDAREAALQIVDIVALRPELELCYLGIQDKCFEILECPDNPKGSPIPREVINVMPSAHLDDDDDDDDDDDLSDDHRSHGHADNYDDSDGMDLLTDQEDADETEDEAQRMQQKVALRLREILFYDEKISIFKARHGKL